MEHVFRNSQVILAPSSKRVGVRIKFENYDIIVTVGLQSFDRPRHVDSGIVVDAKPWRGDDEGGELIVVVIAHLWMVQESEGRGGDEIG